MWKGCVCVFICAVVTVATGQATSGTTDVAQCVRNAGPLPINTYIEGCDTPPCLLPQLQDTVLHVVFQAPHTIRNMKTLASAYLLGALEIPYDLEENAVTCNFLENTYCPLLKDEVVQYTLKMFIEPFFFVGTAATVEFRVVDENDVAVLCVRLPIRIIPPITDSQRAITDSQRANNATLLVDNHQ